MVDIVINESPISHIDEYDAIIVSTNCYQTMRNGFQLEMSKKYPGLLNCNYETKYGDINKLGTIVEYKEDNLPTFILAFTTFLYNFRGNDKDFFEYDALEKCLKLINILYNGKRVATSMIGCSRFDGNANKDRVLEIINREATDFDLTIYDYKQDSYSESNQKEYMNNLKKRYARNKENLRIRTIKAKQKLERKNIKKTRIK